SGTSKGGPSPSATSARHRCRDGEENRGVRASSGERRWAGPARHNISLTPNVDARRFSVRASRLVLQALLDEIIWQAPRSLASRVTQSNTLSEIAGAGMRFEV